MRSLTVLWRLLRTCSRLGVGDWFLDAVAGGWNDEFFGGRLLRRNGLLRRGSRLGAGGWIPDSAGDGHNDDLMWYCSLLFEMELAKYCETERILILIVVLSTSCTKSRFTVLRGDNGGFSELRGIRLSVNDAQWHLGPRFHLGPRGHSKQISDDQTIYPRSM